MKRSFRLGLILVLALVLLASAGCGGTTTTQAASGTTGTAAAGSTTTATQPAGESVLTIAVASDPASMDHDYITFDTVGLSLHKNIYPFMIDYAAKEVAGAFTQDTTDVIPVYAESFETTDNGKTWILKIRKGIKFPSGNELTAKDVKWSKDRAFVAQGNVFGVYRMIGLTKPEQVEIVDDYTVKFTQEYASPLSEHIQIISLFIFDSEEMEKHATADDPWAKEWASRNSTGGGAYNVASWQPGGELVLEANPQYPLGAPGVDKIRLVVIPSSANRRLQLEKGDVDIALDLTRRDIEDLKKNSNLTVFSIPNNEFWHIPLDVSQPPFDNKLVRKAIAYAIPYDQIIQGVFHGDARASTSPVPLDMPGHTDKGYPYTYDLDKAKELLKQAGMENGFSTKLAIDQANEEQEQIAILVQSELKKINIDIEIEKLDPATFNDRRAKKTVPMQIAAGQMWVNDVYYLMGTSLTEGGFLNYAHYNNPAVQEIYEKTGQLTDEAERLKLFEQLQVDILADDVPWIMLAQPNFNVPMAQGVGGWMQAVDALWRLQFLIKD